MLLSADLTHTLQGHAAPVSEVFQSTTSQTAVVSRAALGGIQAESLTSGLPPIFHIDPSTPVTVYIKIRNPTSHTLNFQFGFFGTASYKNYTIAANTAMTFSLNTTYGTQLTPQIHYDSSFNSGYQDQSYALQVGTSSSTSGSSGAGVYDFKTSGSDIDFYKS